MTTNKFLKRSLAGLTALVVALSAGVTAAQAAMPDTVNLTVHYQRTDGDYSAWDVFLWKNMISGTDGASSSCTFDTTDDFGAVAVCPQATGMKAYDNLGFIVRKGGSGWTDKDTKEDRFLTSEHVDAGGKAEIWLKTGDSTIYYSKPKVEVVTPKLTAASIDGLNLITVSFNTLFAIPAGATGDFTVAAGDTKIDVTAVKPLNGSAVKDPAGTTSRVQLTLASNIQFGADYTVSQPTLGSVVATAGSVFDSPGFEAAYTYTGNDLGNTYTPEKTDFRVWAPTASAVKLELFANATDSLAAATEIAMTPSVNGTWTASVAGDKNGQIYLYKATVAGKDRTAVDPYGRAVTKNGSRSVVLDLTKAMPGGWVDDLRPDFGTSNTDAVIYELQVRDLSMDASSGISAANKGKFLALTEQGTSTSFSVTKTVIVKKKKKKVTTNYSTLTGVSAIKDLGVTHVELLPIYDFASGGDEATPTFNWGYDPLNYNTPEGGFSTNPSDPGARIRELKAAIQSLHQQGLGVIMDVVYNHVFDAHGFAMEQLVPGYFFRQTTDGSFVSGLGVGNEVNSERSMVRKFIVDSTTYWASQYHLDGFRFDLMGSLDVTTMNQVAASVRSIYPKFIVLGEGWTLGSPKEGANQQAATSMPLIAHFNDQFRDGVKGSVFNSGDGGYVNGAAFGKTNDVKAGLTGNIDFLGVVTKWTTLNPTQSINYVESHDNMTLYDKLKATLSKPTAANLVAADRQAAALVLLSEGVPFIQAGQEFLRSKGGEGNSYASSDSVNSLKWKQRALNASTVNYYKGLIALRKAHPIFRLATAADVKNRLKFVSSNTLQTISYTLDGTGLAGEAWAETYVAFNPNNAAYTFKLPSAGDWQVVVDGNTAGVATIRTLTGATTVKVPAHSTVVLHR